MYCSLDNCDGGGKWVNPVPPVPSRSKKLVHTSASEAQLEAPKTDSFSHATLLTGSHPLLNKQSLFLLRSSIQVQYGLTWSQKPVFLKSYHFSLVHQSADFLHVQKLQTTNNVTPSYLAYHEFIHSLTFSFLHCHSSISTYFIVQLLILDTSYFRLENDVAHEPSLTLSMCSHNTLIRNMLIFMLKVYCIHDVLETSKYVMLITKQQILHFLQQY